MLTRTLPSDYVGAPPPPPGDDGYRGDGGGSGWGSSRRASFVAMLVILAATAMVFAALTSAFLFLRGVAHESLATPLPDILWLNTAVLLASSSASM